MDQDEDRQACISVLWTLAILSGIVSGLVTLWCWLYLNAFWTPVSLGAGCLVMLILSGMACTYRVVNQTSEPQSRIWWYQRPPRLRVVDYVAPIDPQAPVLQLVQSPTGSPRHPDEEKQTYQATPSIEIRWVSNPGGYTLYGHSHQ
jgi:hypothetical protein